MVAATSPLMSETRLHVVMVGRDDAESSSHMNWVSGLLATRPGATTTIKEGKAEHVIAWEVAVTGSQMLVMGAYGHSALRRLLVGSTTSDMKRACTVPVLLFR